MDYDANNWRFIVRCIVQLRTIHAATSWKSGSEIYFSLAIFYSGHCRIYQQRKYINICPWWTRVFDVLWKLTARASRRKQFTGCYITVKLSEIVVQKILLQPFVVNTLQSESTAFLGALWAQRAQSVPRKAVD
mgnify:CR=1 FL=1